MGSLVVGFALGRAVFGAWLKRGRETTGATVNGGMVLTEYVRSCTWQMAIELSLVELHIDCG